MRSPVLLPVGSMRSEWLCRLVTAPMLRPRCVGGRDAKDEATELAASERAGDGARRPDSRNRANAASCAICSLTALRLAAS